MKILNFHNDIKLNNIQVFCDFSSTYLELIPLENF